MKLNGVVLYNTSGRDANDVPNKRGINTAILYMETCTLYNTVQYNLLAQVPGPNETRQSMMDDIAAMQDKLMLLGVTADEPHNYLSPAYPFLQRLGAPLLNDSVFSQLGKLAFVIQIGSPEKTIFKFKESNTTALALRVNLWGSSLSDVQLEEI
jgi:hypothetical protein